MYRLVDVSEKIIKFVLNYKITFTVIATQSNLKDVNVGSVIFRPMVKIHFLVYPVFEVSF